MIKLSALKSELTLGLGCSTFGGSKSKSQAIYLLESSFDQGIVYYDVARSYGYGQAEQILGSFIQDKRDQVFVASKFGILPPSPNSLKVKLIGLARAAKRMLPFSSKLIQKAAGSSFSRTNFTVQLAQTSLETSLKELNTDYIDLYLLHDCEVSDVQKEDLMAYLLKEKDAGKIRYIGGTFLENTDLSELALGKPKIDAVQVGFTDHFEFLKKESDYLRITFSIFSTAKSVDQSAILSQYPKLEAKLGALNIHDKAFLEACSTMQKGVLLASMGSTQHIERNIALIEAMKSLQ